MTKAKTAVIESLHKGDPRWPVYFTTKELIALRKVARNDLVSEATYGFMGPQSRHVDELLLVKVETIDAELTRRDTLPHWSNRIWWAAAIGTPSIGAIVCVVLWIAGVVR